MNLSPRLKKVIELLDLPANTADIGTDHAYVPIYLANNTDCSKLIASDYNKQPCQAASKHIHQAGIEDRVEVRQGSGLSVLDRNEVTQVIIAGMGSRTIINILEDDYNLAQGLEKLVLQPMAGAGSLRKWLANNNFKIVDESLVREDDRLYQIIAARPGNMEINNEFILELGPKLLENRDSLLNYYFNELEKKWQEVIDKISENDAENPKINYLKTKIRNLAELRSELKI
ncbi:tRNA (adenine(22)-N(1))-methyltransferase [Orenia marismortui]|uniref:tRNA (adenine(22)-N(1))-methyltransferase n=1 Tax=Orenia marismortui TaxID=46469 RepID=UPI0003676A49|nr:class I SAM-dependent methyltransferase [Orenia marismortui]